MAAVRHMPRNGQFAESPAGLGFKKSAMLGHNAVDASGLAINYEHMNESSYRGVDASQDQYQRQVRFQAMRMAGD